METACRVPVDDPEYPTVKSCYTKDLELTGENTLSLYRIYRAHVRQSGKETVKHVVKILDLEKPNPSGGTSDVTLSDVQKEVAVMRGCSHENIVRLHTSFAVESEVRAMAFCRCSNVPLHLSYLNRSGSHARMLVCIPSPRTPDGNANNLHVGVLNF